ncbi:MAG: ATP-binding protein [Thermodesulfobacteriota bacterium]
MITKLRIRWFKSIEDVEFEPGQVNVLIGANGSGKSNLLEALGVLSAAVYGRVDDAGLKQRGVRPGVPALYKCAFSDIKQSKFIYFGAWSDETSYEVNLYNPIKQPLPVWRYYTENLQIGANKIAGRSHSTKEKLNPEAGWIALKAVDLDPEGEVSQLLNALRDFAIYAPDTNTLRSQVEDRQPRSPMGLSGGGIPPALASLLRSADSNPYIAKVCQDALLLIDWAKSYDVASASSVPLSPSVGSAKRVIKFVDRFMKSGRDTLTGYDASEGALYVLFHAVLAGHPDSPSVCAVDNADHGLNPVLARSLLTDVCQWYLDSPRSRQVFLTTQNPSTLDGLPLNNDQVRLFAVDRSRKGRTTVTRVLLDERIRGLAEKGWTLSRTWVMGHLGGVPNV